MSLQWYICKATCIMGDKATLVHTSLLPTLTVGTCNPMAHMYLHAGFVNKVMQMGSVVTHSQLLFSCYKPQ